MLPERWEINLNTCHVFWKMVGSHLKYYDKFIITVFIDHVTVVVLFRLFPSTSPLPLFTVRGN